jgi:hypothetical protein
MTPPVGFDWKALLLYMKERRVVPIIGPELARVSVGGVTLPLDRYLAQRLVEPLNVSPAALGASYGLSDVASVFLRNERGDRRRLWVEILSVLEEQAIQPAECLLQLAAITDFNLFVTTTFDPLMIRALERVRGGIAPQHIQAYSLRSQVLDLADEWASAQPLSVYQLFGRVSASGDYVVTDEDRLEFIHALQSEGRQPCVLFDQLRDSHLLLIGCSFPDWLTRFFLRTLRRERLSVDRDRYEAVADDRTATDQPLVMFLGDCGVQVFADGGTEQFVAELATRWRAQTPPAPPAAPAPVATKGKSVFLSYASEDRERVVRIKEALEGAGIRVWFDQRALEPGEEYKQVIRDAIKDCVFFLPCISANALTGQIRRFFRFEWNAAIDEADFRQAEPPFIQPLLLDDTAADSEKIPPPFRDRHMQQCRDGVLPAEFVALTRDRFAALGGQP